MELTLNQISAAAAILVFIGFAIYKALNNKDIILSDIVIAIIAGGMLPLAVGFALYPFYPHIIGSIEEMSLQITVTGLVLIHVYLTTIIDKAKTKKEKPDSS